MIAAFREWQAGRESVLIAAIASFALVLLNAWLGMKVVLSGLKPGVITLHMGLAMLLLCVLVYTAWRGCERPWGLALKSTARAGRAWLVIGVLFLLTIAEGLMGSQVREMTDALAKVHTDEPRSAWTAELESTWMYLAHRSFSWLVLASAIAFYVFAKRALVHGARWLEKSILGLVLAQMVLGIILSHIGILRVVQVLHIGLSSLLVSGLFLWMLGCVGVRER